MTEEQHETLLEVTGLSVRIGKGAEAVRPVENVDIGIRHGETFALLGESGCGKSMTALAIMRLLPEAASIVAGDVRLEGGDLLALSEKAMRLERGGRVGMIFQEPMTSLNPVMTVGRQIGEAVALHDADNRDRIDERVVELLTAVGIPDPVRRAAEYPHQLSGGMKQRIMIAMALAGRPKLLIADEPTTALDVTIQAQVLTLLKDLQQETRMAILLITHDLGVVAEVADRVAVMYAGEIVETRDRAEFFEAPMHPYSRRLFEALPTTQKRTRALAVIPGNVPSLDQEFAGCRFAERCPLSDSSCRDTRPPWRGEPGGDGYRCLLTETGMPTEEVAEQILAAIRREQLHVFTHQEVKSALALRSSNLLRGVDPWIDPGRRESGS